MRARVAADATRWCVASVDQAIARLSTEIARMDAIDLAGPWIAGAPTRSERITALALRMGQVVVAGDTADGRLLADALGRAWPSRRARSRVERDRARSEAWELSLRPDASRPNGLTVPPASAAVAPPAVTP